ncbi:DUF2306 domain-containing protein [Nocardiopsis composta]|uniref:Uncharacterized membrane protein YozB (DUF420 family) n=1 Tax=Nocardiopsis composta TaxID=157465 RepID=A0A7W8QPI9_9ACTN|nr:DUF2306 domain-containing protein [Nocardiopsis composta]MBB5433799.1 uncharacterized membrane protein YozB (DUF420 family) [Nocardiopsis composta]
MTSPTLDPAPAERPRRPRRSTPWWRRPWVAPLALATLVFLSFSVPRYAALDPEQALFFAEGPAWSYAWYYPVLVTHIFAGAVAMLAVCLQVWPWLRRRHPAVHRWSGRVYVWLGLPLVGLASLAIAPLSSTGPGTAVSNVVWSLLWITCTAAGYLAVRRRRHAEHRVWMLRSFALIFAIALNRIWAVVCTAVMLPLLDTAFAGDEAAMMMTIAASSSWLSWTVNLIAVEWWMQHRGRARAGNRARRAAVGTA